MVLGGTQRRRLLILSALVNPCISFQSFVISPLRTTIAAPNARHKGMLTFLDQGTPVQKKKTLLGAKNTFTKKNNANDDDSFQVNPLYFGLATLETVFWWYLAPGIDPNSRWFAPDDGVLISKLFDPSIVLSPPPGSGLGFSSLLLNTFLIIPAVWSLLLLQEEEHQIITPLPFCLAGFLVGGGSLIPYMIVRKPRKTVDPAKFSPALKFFEEGHGPIFLIVLTMVVLTTFVMPFLFGSSEFEVEFMAFQDRINNSQFTSLALFDFTMISCSILDPMIDDAKGRNYIHNDTTLVQGAQQLLPFLIPLVGPVAWIYFRPKYLPNTEIV